MKHFQFYLSYSSSDRVTANIFVEKMEKAGFSVYNPITCAEPGKPYAMQIVSAISNCDNFIILLTKSAMHSEHILNEIEVALERHKNMIPIFLEELDLTDDFRYYIGRKMRLVAGGKDEISIQRIVDSIDSTYGSQLKRNALYEKLSEYQKIKNTNREAETLCELIALVVNEFKQGEESELDQSERAKELYLLYESLSSFCGGYDAETRALAISVMETLSAAREIFLAPTFTSSLYYAAIALNCIYFEYEIATECVDIRTGGDVRNPFPIENRIERQKPFLAIYEQYCTKEGNFKTELNYLTGSEKMLIAATALRIFAYQVRDPDRTHSPTKTESKTTVSVTPDDEILLSIADFMQKGNELFNVLHKTGVAGDFLKCLLTSYERLKNYCMIVGATKVAADCVEEIAKIRQELAAEAPTETNNPKAENGIKTLLGFTTQESGEYDVFISFKSEDNDLAKTVYQFCKKNMIAAFWSKVSLPEMSKSDYGDAIDSALDSSKHFVLVLSDLAYLETDWIKYEMSTFADEIREGRKEGANFVILATDKVYNELISSNKKALPIKYRWCQILKLSEYEDTLLNYLK